ncbi:MAG: GNAT family N-acetyltransferase [Sporomusaceae bacterium]|nr:GNAT family N-acetyltransferase [Sporomusaceae bacterium]
MIRSACEADLVKISQIYNHAILYTTAVYDEQEHSLAERKFWFDKKCQKGFPVLVFEQDGEVAGFASYGPFRDWPGYRYTIEHSVYVDEQYRKSGVGTKLLQELIRLAAEQGYKTLVAGIDAANDASIAMHEKLGFTFSGTVKQAGYKFDRWLDLSFYQYELPGPQPERNK